MMTVTVLILERDGRGNCRVTTKAADSMMTGLTETSYGAWLVGETNPAESKFVFGNIPV